MISLHLRILTAFFLFIVFPNVIFPLTVNFAVPACGEGLDKLRTWDPLRKYLEDNIDLDINLIITRDHSIIRDQLENKNYDFAVIDSFWIEHWEKREICSPFLELRKSNCNINQSILIVHKNSIFRSPEDLKNSSLALTLPGDSSIGFYIPMAMMLQIGIDPFSYFKEIVFPETFESILKAIAYGKLDSGFISSDFLTNPENQQYADDVRVLMESEPLETTYIVVRKDFNEKLLIEIKGLMTNLGNSAEGQNFLNTIDLTGFGEPENLDSHQTREYLNILELKNASPE